MSLYEKLVNHEEKLSLVGYGQKTILAEYNGNYYADDSNHGCRPYGDDGKKWILGCRGGCRKSAEEESAGGSY